MAHPHEDLVRRGYEAFVNGDMETLRELFDPEISGTSRAAACWPATTADPTESWGSLARRSS
jgi:ketosteroid isomerase-like protein